MNFIKMFSGKIWLFGILIMLIASSCGTDDPERQAERDRKKILDYIRTHQLTAHELESGVFYVINSPGSGSFPTQTSTVSVSYTGKLLSGKVFDTGIAQVFNLQQTILGFKYGIPMFNKGSKGKLLIPSGLGYGPNGTFSIPPNAVLIFEIEMIDFN